MTLRSSSTAPRSSSLSVKESSNSSSASMSSCSCEERGGKKLKVFCMTDFKTRQSHRALTENCNKHDTDNLSRSYPGEVAGLGAAELQAVPLQRALTCREAAQRAAAILQDVGQFGLQPLNGGSCSGRGVHRCRFRGTHGPTPPSHPTEAPLHAQVALSSAHHLPHGAPQSPCS